MTFLAFFFSIDLPYRGPDFEVKTILIFFVFAKILNFCMNRLPRLQQGLKKSKMFEDSKVML
jgi:hypothetical protein